MVETSRSGGLPDSVEPQSSSRTGASLADFGAALRNWRLAAWLGWQDAISPFRRTFIGPFWISIQTGLWVVIIVVFLGPVLGGGMENYTLYVAVGTVVFQFMSTLLVDGAAAFTRNSGLIKNIPNPLGLYLLRVLFKGLILMVAQAPVIVAAAFFTPSGVPFMAVLSLFGVALTGWTLVGVYLTLATVTPRFRDIPFALNAVMRVMMFVTPIFWIPESRGGIRGAAAAYNPLAQMLNVIREPFLGSPPPMSSVLYCLAFGSVFWVLGFVLFTRNRSLISAQL